MGSVAVVRGLIALGHLPGPGIGLVFPALSLVGTFHSLRPPIIVFTGTGIRTWKAHFAGYYPTHCTSENHSYYGPDLSYAMQVNELFHTLQQTVRFYLASASMSLT